MKSTFPLSPRTQINVLRLQNPSNVIQAIAKERQRAETRESHSPRREE